MIVIILGVGGQAFVTADFVIAVIAVAIAVIVITVLHKLFQILSLTIIN